MAIKKFHYALGLGVLGISLAAGLVSNKISNHSSKVRDQQSIETIFNEEPKDFFWLKGNYCFKDDNKRIRSLFYFYVPSTGDVSIEGEVPQIFARRVSFTLFEELENGKYFIKRTSADEGYQDIMLRQLGIRYPLLEESIRNRDRIEVKELYNPETKDFEGLEFSSQGKTLEKLFSSPDDEDHGHLGYYPVNIP